MFVITNRKVQEVKTCLDQFGKTPNEKGNNELRLAQVTKRKKSYTVKILDDQLDKAEARELIQEFKLFTWPANGGGVGGKLSYLDDKRDARASAGALERSLKKVHEYLMLISESSRNELRKKAAKKHPDNAKRRDSLYANLLRDDCPFTVNGLFHSMGNYLYKQMLKSTISEGNNLIFDNVVLCQADTNNAGHPNWVDTISHNRRVLITISENDFALRLSRIKPGDAQRARLGHYIKRLDSRIAHYINLTDASWAQESHSPFGEPAEKNEKLREFFRQALSGEPAEGGRGIGLRGIGMRWGGEWHRSEEPRAGIGAYVSRLDQRASTHVGILTQRPRGFIGKRGVAL